MVLGVDPGETTGVSIVSGADVLLVDQLPTKTVHDGVLAIYALLESNPGITRLICEDYRVYEWEAQTHTWANLHTPKLIGAIECLCMCRDIPFSTRMAHDAKEFVTDEKLKMWKIYQHTANKQHGRDALRHAIYSILFD